MGIEEDDVESIEIQFNEIEELFKECVEHQKVNKRPQHEFIKSLTNELTTAKLTNNISNSDFTSILLDVVLSTVFPISKKEKEESQISNLSAKEVVIEIQKLFKNYQDLFKAFCGGEEQSTKLIDETEYHCSKNDKLNFSTIL